MIKKRDTVFLKPHCIVKTSTTVCKCNSFPCSVVRSRILFSITNSAKNNSIYRISLENIQERQVKFRNDRRYSGNKSNSRIVHQSIKGLCELCTLVQNLEYCHFICRNNITELVGHKSFHETVYHILCKSLEYTAVYNLEHFRTNQSNCCI